MCSARSSSACRSVITQCKAFYGVESKNKITTKLARYHSCTSWSGLCSNALAFANASANAAFAFALALDSFAADAFSLAFAFDSSAFAFALAFDSNAFD